jgi:hypothetical protein
VTRSTAPQLPVPKQRWSGIVYLHGVIPENPVAVDLDTLVLSSGDFGLAYLTEGYAARFVEELVRNHVVCFVGYRINGSVLRYIVDALAADRLLGEAPSEVFAFGGYSKGKETEQLIEWSAKHVTPILYRAHSNHFYLHKTLQSWADHYRDGILGNERLLSVMRLVHRPQVRRKMILLVESCGRSAILVACRLKSLLILIQRHLSSGSRD